MTARALLIGLVALLRIGEMHAQAVREEPPQPRPQGFTLNASIDVPLSYDDASSRGEETQGEESFRSPRTSLVLRYSPPDTRLFGRIGVHGYLDPAKQAPWNPDFSYGFGFDDWRPGTYSLTYDNGGGNRLNPDRNKGESYTRFEEGVISATYRIPISRRIESIFVPHPDDRISASAGVHVTPRFRQEGSPSRGEWKKVVSLGVRNRFYRWWFVEARAYYYPESSQQQPWDPDYTWALGYFDWHPGRVSVQYSNFAGNRFPGRESGRRTSWRDGALTISWSHAW